ncbi:MAG: MmgE/PrpD family protein, partial [Opitutaceae bacterium]|nr:MmgE/PrpD family protein [Opitutaceae bacterium]
ALQTATRHERARHLPLVVILGLLCGRLIPEHLADEVVIDPRIGALLARTRVHTDASFAREFLDPEKLAAPHSVQLFFNDGSSTERIVARYPAGHRHHRLQSLPLHFEKALAALACRFEEDRIEDILGLFDDSASLQSMPVSHFVNLWVP